MLSEPLRLNDIGASDLFDFLYEFFHRDFVSNQTYLADSIYINPRSHQKEDGKERDFWHIVTKNQSVQVRNGRQVCYEKQRLPDYRRAERIEWVKQILVNHSDPAVKLFYHRESNPKRNVRLYLWAHEDDFVVILQKLGRSDSFLVTSFYIDYARKRQEFQDKFERYVSGNSEELTGCEWF